ADKGSEHHVALTQQGTSNLPPRLREAAKNSGGRLHLLDRRGSLLRIAHSLRRIASDVDFIVLHVHPDDVVPTLAFGAGIDHPPIAYLNHADHVFWIGSEICDINLNIRESA